MAVGLDTGVPWVMCKQEDAPDPVVSVSVHIFYVVFVFLLYICHFPVSTIGIDFQLVSPNFIGGVL